MYRRTKANDVENEWTGVRAKHPVNIRQAINRNNTIANAPNLKLY